MRKYLLAGIAALILPASAFGRDAEVPATPNGIVDAAPAADWIAIAPRDLLVMDLAPGSSGIARRVVIQLVGATYAQGWVSNIRTLAAQHWYDGLAIVRTQDNYVVQWGDPDGENRQKAKPLPEGLRIMTEGDYAVPAAATDIGKGTRLLADAYASGAGFDRGWPVASDGSSVWPVHCYGSVGVGRNLSPDTGTGGELYAVIGQAPRQLDRNIAVVGRVIEGMEYLSALPRGTGPMGFYATPQERTPIVSARTGEAVTDLARYEYLSTTSASFAAYLDKRANRRDAFYIHPAGGVDVCNVPVPVRRAAQ
ncbi:peptidylprolyl isomerase [Novosphingobium mathurense]|uniref:peptidylprolyl isomerase n=1 Tax=Novosphingobium mathurense TaxID=428990 RepID=A0A1U6ID33_9SPHN|nr:peptidylprolyl isomerase [Novosphingobium mathurense]SLK05907.1 peptidylprolyl isomerase [Novosphingobium mathurense]